ncbi:MAG: IS630 family transposase [bacterium]
MFVSEFCEEIAEKAFKKCCSLKGWKIIRRMLFVILKFKGYPTETIADILSVSETTIYNWLSILREGGLDALAKLNYKGQPSELNAHSAQLSLELEEKPVATLKEAQHHIEQKTGIKRSLSQVRAFLQKHKIVRRKVGQIPAKADIEKQNNFKKNKLDRLVKLAQNHRIRLLFMDASHFVHLPFLGYLYSLKRVFIRSASGRKRFNVLGALDAITHTVTMVCNQTYINAISVCQLLELIATQYAGEKIYIVLDNARYQKCQMVKDMAKSLGIHLVFLPAYSPRFNLIERLWRFVKKKVLYNEFYAKFDLFKNAITDCLQKVKNGEYAEELSTLLTLNFQSYEHSKINP